MANDLVVAALAKHQLIERFEDHAFFAGLLNSAVISFVALKVIGQTADGVDIYEDIDTNGTTNTFPSDPTKADVVLHGSIKWDGCSNWDFHDQDCMVHFCGYQDAGSLGRLIEHFYRVAAERLPSFDRKLAHMEESNGKGT